MKLNYKRTFFIGLAFLSISSFWQVYDNTVPLMLKNTFGIGDTLAGVVMALDNVLALFLLPLFGALSDKVRTPLGKRTPFILVGTAGAVAAMLFIPLADNRANLAGFSVALGLALLAMSVYRAPAVALMPDVTPKPLRSQANAVINLMGALGGIVALAFMSFRITAEGKPNYLPIFAAISTLMVVAVLVLVLTVKENKLVAEVAESGGLGGAGGGEEAPATSGEKLPKEVQRSLILILVSVALWFMGYNAVTTAFSKYAQVRLGIPGGGFAGNLMVATAAAILTYYPAGLVASKIGRKKTILGGVVLMGVSLSAAALYQSYHPTLNLLLVLLGMGWATINVNSYPMVVEMAKGSDIGKYTGYYYTFSMTAQILTPILSGALLEYVGYETLFPYAAFFMVLAFCTMLQVRHGDNRPTAPQTITDLIGEDDPS